jgi:hypothetical protein
MLLRWHVRVAVNHCNVGGCSAQPKWCGQTSVFFVQREKKNDLDGMLWAKNNNHPLGSITNNSPFQQF